jgi:hypothetical protein
MSVAARVSMILAVQQHVDGAFPVMQTYPAAFERRVEGEAVKVFAATGTIPAGAGGVTLNVPAALSTVTHWMVENLAAADGSGTANVVVAGAPVNGTVPRGQVVFATNEVAGWPAASVTLTGTAGTAYKVIALGV